MVQQMINKTDNVIQRTQSNPELDQTAKPQ